MSKIKSKPNDREIPVKFKPRARLLLQLGDQLIRNESVALIELVKNSYDADANEVDIYMENIDASEKGVIIIEDDGYGMSLEVVENVWMEPGSDFKTEKFLKREFSPKYKRLPIGEKGIGRFGVHKLGNNIELTTKMADSNEVFVKIDWSIFNNYRYLDQVPIKVIERENPEKFKNGKTGTNIVISNLRKEWTRGTARNVKRTINSLVSPFETNDSFKANFNITDKPAWFDGLLEWDEVKEFSLFKFKVVLKGDKITDFLYEFVPWQTMSKIDGRTINLENDLVSNFQFIQDDEEDYVNLAKNNIGDVIFEGFIFDRDSFVMNLGISDKRGFKEYLNSNSGVRVYRDGLRVYDYGEPENDWLGLDLRRVNQPSKRISNNIVMGAVYLSRDKSDSLIEKTNREGFVENDAYIALRNSIIHSLNLIETLRFSDKQRLREVYGPTRKSEPVYQIIGELKNFVDKKVKDIPVRDEITKYLVKIEDDYKRINENLLKAAGAGLSMSVVVHEIEKIIQEVQKVIIAEKGSERLIKLVKHLSSLIEGYSEIIKKSTQTNEDLKKVISQALFNTEYRLNSHKISITKQYLKYKGNPKTKIARSLFIGSLMNVIDNSIFWLEKAGRQDKQLYVDLIEDNDFLNIIIADNGSGILLPTEEIIEPFVSAKPGGIGLGLHIANEIMLAQKGKLSFPEYSDYELPVEFKGGAIICFSFKK
jgi:signal transduction histidine kinase